MPPLTTELWSAYPERQRDRPDEASATTGEKAKGKRQKAKVVHVMCSTLPFYFSLLPSEGMVPNPAAYVWKMRGVGIRA
jgi:hypothetical protein